MAQGEGQVPWTQTPLLHTTPHPPQFAESILVSTQAEPQSVNPEEQPLEPPEPLAPPVLAVVPPEVVVVPPVLVVPPETVVAPPAAGAPPELGAPPTPVLPLPWNPMLLTQKLKGVARVLSPGTRTITADRACPAYGVPPVVQHVVLNEDQGISTCWLNWVSCAHHRWVASVLAFGASI
jgi:hypothetical protein